MSQHIIQIGSLDLFWMPRLQKALTPVADTELYSTWSLKKSAPNPGLKTYNNAILHYTFQITRMYPWFNFHNRSYYTLCRLFDNWFTNKIHRDVSAISYLSGVGLKAGRKAKLLGIPSIIECGSTHTDFQHEVLAEEYAKNGFNFCLFPEVYRNEIKQEFNEADFIQVPSTFAKKTFIERGFSEDKLILAPYGADIDLFKSKSRPSGNAPFRVICPSGVNLRKGARLLAETWKKLGWNNAELHWLGTPGLDTKHLFKDKPDNIIFEPWRSHNELAELYRSCDVMVLPSIEDGFAMVIVEAAACGLPIITTPRTCAEDFFTADSPEGWLIPTNDVDALCQALTEARADREKTFQLGQRAAIRAHAFSWDAYGEKVRANYETILG